MLARSGEIGQRAAGAPHPVGYYAHCSTNHRGRRVAKSCGEPKRKANKKATSERHRELKTLGTRSAARAEITTIRGCSPLGAARLADWRGAPKAVENHNAQVTSEKSRERAPCGKLKAARAERTQTVPTWCLMQADIATGNVGKGLRTSRSD